MNVKDKVRQQEERLRRTCSDQLILLEKLQKYGVGSVPLLAIKKDNVVVLKAT